MARRQAEAMEPIAPAHDGAEEGQYRSRRELLQQEADRCQRRVDVLQQELKELAREGSEFSFVSATFEHVSRGGQRPDQKGAVAWTG